MFRVLAAVVFAVGAAATAKKFVDAWETGQDLGKHYLDSNLSPADANKQLTDNAGEWFRRRWRKIIDNPFTVGSDFSDYGPILLGVDTADLETISELLEGIKSGKISDSMLDSVDLLGDLKEFCLAENNREAVAVLARSGVETFEEVMERVEQKARAALRSLAAPIPISERAENAAKTIT